MNKTKKKITAVVLHYYSQRTKNVEKIINALQLGILAPDKIILFNNNKDVQYPKTKGVSVINSDTNYGGRGRYPIALLEPSDYYFFIDDDMSPSKNTLKNFMKYAEEGCCLGYIGKVITENEDYMSAKAFFGDEMSKVTDVDLLVGNGSIFVSFTALFKMFETEKGLLKEGFIFGREEDIILSMSNDPKVIPAKYDEDLIKLPEEGVGYWRDPSHINLRDEMVRRLYRRAK